MTIDEDRLREIIRTAFDGGGSYETQFTNAVRAVMDELDCGAVKARWLVKVYGAT